MSRFYTRHKKWRKPFSQPDRLLCSRERWSSKLVAALPPHPETYLCETGSWQGACEGWRGLNVSQTFLKRSKALAGTLSVLGPSHPRAQFVRLTHRAGNPLVIMIIIGVILIVAGIVFRMNMTEGERRELEQIRGRNRQRSVRDDPNRPLSEHELAHAEGLLLFLISPRGLIIAGALLILWKVSNSYFWGT